MKGVKVPTILIVVGLSILILVIYRNIGPTKELFSTNSAVMKKTNCIRNAMYHGYKRCDAKYPYVNADFSALRVDDFFTKPTNEQNLNKCTTKSCPYLPTGTWVPQINID
jgi:hypothetical protein